MNALRSQWLIARTIFIESVRRKEIYAVILVSLLLIVSLRFVQFFDVEGLGKFYREVALKTMNIATGLTVLILASRQLPREFKNRTLYPLLAKPVSRATFLLGKFAGVMLAAMFCYGVFMVIFVGANLTLRTPFNVPMFLQSILLQLVALSVLAALGFMFSMMLNTDAAITMGCVLFAGSQVLLNTATFLYGSLGPLAQKAVLAILYLVPQLTLLDASERVVHGQWEAIPARSLALAVGYGLTYTVAYLAVAYFLFRRKSL